jgi:hypothetical protein
MATAKLSLELISLAFERDELYCSLVPWIFSRDQLCFASWAKQRPSLPHVGRYFSLLTPADVRSSLCELIDAECGYACGIAAHACSHTQIDAVCPLLCRHCSQESAPLPPAATKLAKLHGHMIAQGFMPDTLNSLRRLFQLIMQGPMEQQVPPVVFSLLIKLLTKAELPAKKTRILIPDCFHHAFTTCH